MTARRDPYLSFCFIVEIQVAGISKATGFFKSAGGLSSETEVVDFREGGLNTATHKLLGVGKFKNIVLKRGFGGTELAAWRDQWLQPPFPARATGTIKQLDTLGKTLATWTFSEAFPVKWELSEFDASKNEVSIETLEIAHEGLVRS